MLTQRRSRKRVGQVVRQEAASGVVDEVMVCLDPPLAVGPEPTFIRLSRPTMYVASISVSVLVSMVLR